MALLAFRIPSSAFRVRTRSILLAAVVSLLASTPLGAQYPPPAAPTVQFSASSYSAPESSGTAAITVSLSAAATGPASVDYATSDGTAKAGVNYTAASGTLTINPGASNTFTVTLVKDGKPGPNTSLNLTLSNVRGGGATLGTPSAAVLTIVDDDPKPTVQFSMANYTVMENAGAATVTVTLSPASTQNVSVGYCTDDETAIAGVNYSAVQGQLTFNPRETVKTFVVPILNDRVRDPTLTLALYLFDPLGAQLGAVPSAQLSIADDTTSEPYIYFDPNYYVVTDQSGTATLNVALSQPSSVEVRVDYATHDGTTDPTVPEYGAVAPRDYLATSGTLVFAPGETAKPIVVPLVNNVQQLQTKYFWVELMNPVAAIFRTQSLAVDPKSKVDKVADPYRITRDNKDAINLDISDGQANDAAECVLAGRSSNDGIYEDLKRNRGAVTVANLNDTDGDGIPDVNSTFPVQAKQTTLTVDVAAGPGLLKVASVQGFSPNQWVIIRRDAPNDKTGQLAQIASVRNDQTVANQIWLKDPGLKQDFAAGSIVAHTGRDNPNNANPTGALREEVDLMKIIIRQPAKKAVGKNVKLSCLSGNVRVWKNYFKGVAADQVVLPVQYDSANDIPAGGLTLWVEAVAPSAALRDIVLKLEYDDGAVRGLQWDIVKATAVWVARNQRPAGEGGPWLTRGTPQGNPPVVPTAFPDNPDVGANGLIKTLVEPSIVNVVISRQAVDGSRYGSGYDSKFGGIDRRFSGRILWEFQIGPAGADRLAGVRFDVTRQKATRADHLLLAKDAFLPVRWVQWPWLPHPDPALSAAPKGLESANDESQNNLDNQNVPVPGQTLIYSWDGPGWPSYQEPRHPDNAKSAFMIQRADFVEWVRVRFDGSTPGGDNVDGSRCSDLNPWSVSNYLVRSSDPKFFADATLWRICAPKYTGAGNGTLSYEWHYGGVDVVTEGFTLTYNAAMNQWTAAGTKSNAVTADFDQANNNWRMTIFNKLRFIVAKGNVDFKDGDKFELSTVMDPKNWTVE